MTLASGWGESGVKGFGGGCERCVKKKKAGIFDFDNYVFVKIVERAQITVG